MKKWQSILLYLGVAYIVLLLGPIAGFDLPKIIGEIASNPEVFIQQLYYQKFSASYFMKII